MTGMFSRYRVALLAALCLVPATRVVSAQATSTNGTALAAPDASIHKRGADITWGAIDGDVVDVSGAALVGVQVVLLDAPRVAVHTGPGGAFRIDSLPAGPHLLRFRRVGISPLNVPVVVKGNEITSVDAVLAPLARRLQPVVVQAENGELLRLPPDVAARVHSGLGHYITSAQIERMHAVQMGDVLRSAAGLEVVGPSGNERVRNTRGFSALWDQEDATGHKVGTNCADGMPIFLDGAGTGQSTTVSSIDVILPSEVALVEIYKDAVEIPATLPQSACGAIFIWTK